MATIQSRKSRGHKYWYIVESRRVNGKPRPITLAYLGKADDLLRRLQGLTDGISLKSYSHGSVAALLNIARKLDIVFEINKHIHSPRPYFAKKPLRNNLTAGITLLLAAIGRVCMPTSKRGWWNWAQTTSCEYLLRTSLRRMDSQHFWDLMDALPSKAIPDIEQALLNRVLQSYGVHTDSLFFDTTNFYTYIHTCNTRCKIAQRGKNKQKRYDLRQVGLALVVTRGELIPLFHLTYQGNLADVKVFSDLASRIRHRMRELNLDITKHTLVFDRGNNSKANLRQVSDMGLYYVGALTPYHHRKLIEDAVENYKEIELESTGQKLQVYRDRRIIWGEERTVIVFISEKLKQGQLRGIYRDIDKRMRALEKLKTLLTNSRARKLSREEILNRIETLLKGQYMRGLFFWELTPSKNGSNTLHYSLNINQLTVLEETMGMRIVMTNRHDWSSEQIISTYHGQSNIERAFRNMKNPYHLALRPQYHWTDQKITVHFFLCVLGYLMTSLLWREAKRKACFPGSIENMIDQLNAIRLATILENSATPGKMKANYVLEKSKTEEMKLMKALGIEDYHEKRPNIIGLRVYTQPDL